MNSCIDCKYCKMESCGDACASYYLCKRFYSIDPITGAKIYQDCEVMNRHGECKEYEDGWFVKLKKIFGL